MKTIWEQMLEERDLALGREIRERHEQVGYCRRCRGRVYRYTIKSRNWLYHVSVSTMYICTSDYTCLSTYNGQDSAISRSPIVDKKHLPTRREIKTTATEPEQKPVLIKIFSRDAIQRSRQPIAVLHRRGPPKGE